MLSRRMFFKAGPALAIGAAIESLPPDVIRQAWIEGTKAMRKRIMETNESAFWPKKPEEVDFSGSEYEEGMKAALKVAMEHLAKQKA